MDEKERRRQAFRALVDDACTRGAYPVAAAFRRAHDPDGLVVESLLRDSLVREHSGRFQPTLEGLRRYYESEARSALAAATRLLPILQEGFRGAPGDDVAAGSLHGSTGLSEWEIERGLTELLRLPIWESFGLDSDGFVTSVTLRSAVLDYSMFDVPGGAAGGKPAPSAPPAEAAVTTVSVDELWPAHDSGDTPVQRAADVPVATFPLVRGLEIDGYGPFRRFAAELDALTVLVGANGAGKSSLFGFLRFLSRAMSGPIPPGLDARLPGRRAYHADGPERLRFAASVVLDADETLRYACEIGGPQSEPRVLRERLSPRNSSTAVGAPPFLRFESGVGEVWKPAERRLVCPDWAVGPDELALPRAGRDEAAPMIRLRDAIAGWRVYSGFDVGPASALRRPTLTEASPVLAADGANLSAVLLWLNRRHPPVWAQIEDLLRKLTPRLVELNVEPRGGPGTVIGTWREEGLGQELSLADLSDGTLRFLCWAVLCLSPDLPSLLCIDEPDAGLHPRAQSLLAPLLRHAAQRTQVLIATHSPHFMACFRVAEVAFLRRENGGTRLVRPDSREALRELVRDVVGEVRR